MSKIKMAVIGLGGRGMGMLDLVMLPMENIIVTAVCDVYQDRCEDAVALVEKRNGNRPQIFCDYHELLEVAEIDAAYIVTSWQTHIEIAIACMNHHVAVASDVSGAFSIEECWELVKTYERTKTPIMLMENCCYGRDEMMVMHMIRNGLFGEVVHCAGGYHHDLRHEITYGKENRHYRLDNYKHRNCENYPTHELGPIAQILGINHGNKMLSLVSMSSKSAGLKEYVREQKPEDNMLQGKEFAQGDVVTTIIKCAHGETITLTLDTTLPRAYSRGFYVQGTKAIFQEDNRSLFLDGIHNEYDFCWKDHFNNIDQYRDEYEHPVWQSYLKEGVKGGHDGMDWLVMEDFVQALLNNKPMPIDVYDMASWLAVSVLSEQSIGTGSSAVYFPDFTNGKWMVR